MKLTCLALIFLFTTFAYAQRVQLNGTVMDAQAGQPIASVTISIKTINAYFRTDNKGRFEIASDKITVNDTLAFSCVGYQPKKIKVDSLLRNGVVKLSPAVNILNEVKVDTKPVTLIKVGSRRKSGYEHGMAPPAYKFAMFMEGSKDVKGNIQRVGFFLTKGHGMFKGGDVTAPFRIRLFSVDTNSMPGQELTKDSIIVYAKKEWAWFDVDISAYHIKNPDSGFFVCFSLLDYQHYRPINQADTVAAAYSGESGSFGKRLTPEESGQVKFSTPRICYTSDKFNPSRSYLYGYDAEDNRLHWLKEYDNQSYMIRAAIAPE